MSWETLAKQVSEVDLSEKGNVVVGVKLENRALTLLMGDRNFKRAAAGFLRALSGDPQEGAGLLFLRFTAR